MVEAVEATAAAATVTHGQGLRWRWRGARRRSSGRPGDEAGDAVAAGAASRSSHSHSLGGLLARLLLRGHRGGEDEDAMAARVAEVLPHVPRERVLRELRRAGSVERAVHNLLDAQ